MSLYYVVSAERPQKGRYEIEVGVYLIKSPTSTVAHERAKQSLRDEYKIPVQHHIRTRTIYSHAEEAMAREFWERFMREWDRAQS